MLSWHSWLIAALTLQIVLLVVLLILEHRRPAQMTAWLLISFLIPFIGFVSYLMLGKDFTRRRLTSRYQQGQFHYADQKSEIVTAVADIGNEQLEQQEKLFAMLKGLAPLPITKRNETLVLTNGQATYEAILEQLELAAHHIHLNYYTIRDDEIGQRFLHVLTRKAREGVEVRVLYDGMGSIHLSDSYIRKMEEAGVQTSCFLRPWLAFYERKLNYRNHRKIVVVDGLVGFVGGINIGDEYVGTDPKLGFWRDTHLRLKGDAVYDLQELFMNDWAFAAGKKLEGEAYLPVHSCDAKERVLMVSSKPGRNDQHILEIWFAAITAAKERIYITTPYFIPDPSIVMGLRTAALSGVDVRLIIPGIPDSKLVLLATLSYVQQMLEAGVRVYRYEKGFIHAKVLLIDQMLASVGTANMDMRSLYSNFELNAVLFDRQTIDRLEEDFIEDLKDSIELKLQTFIRRPLRQKAAEAILHMVSPLL